MPKPTIDTPDPDSAQDKKKKQQSGFRRRNRTLNASNLIEKDSEDSGFVVRLRSFSGRDEDL